MRCAEIQSSLPAFVLGGLEPEEAAEVERHLASCPGCQDELRELRKVSCALEAAPAPRATPPSYLKDEILTQVLTAAKPPSSHEYEREDSATLREQQRPLDAPPRSNRFKHLRLILPSVAAATIVAMLAFGVFFGYLREEPPVATIQLIPTPEEAAGLNGYWGVAEIRPQPSGNQQVELKLNNFEKPKPNSYYELWFVSGEKRISAGSFTSVGQGETIVLLNVPPEARKYHTLLITEEHIDKSPPTSQEVALKGEAP